MSSCEHKYHEHFNKWTCQHKTTDITEKTSNTLKFERGFQIHIILYIYNFRTFQNPCASTCYVSCMGSKSLHSVRSHLYKRAVVLPCLFCTVERKRVTTGWLCTNENVDINQQFFGMLKERKWWIVCMESNSVLASRFLI